MCSLGGSSATESQSLSDEHDRIEDIEMSTPLVSVVMGVYNGEPHLRKSVESILSQDGVEFEFIIVNDGSSDSSPILLEDYAAREVRIRVVHHSENLGLTKALIRGCAEARGEFIARQDCGDISLPGRLKAQSDHLRQHAEVILVVTAIRQIVGEGFQVGQVLPIEDPEELNRNLRDEMVGIPAHGCSMFRRDAYLHAGGYREEFYYAQDCDLWLRLVALGKTGAIAKILYELNLEVGGISTSRHGCQRSFARLAQQAYRARQSGKSDVNIVSEAGRLRNMAIRDRNRKPGAYGLAGAHYRLGSLLEAVGQPDAVNHYMQALKKCPYYWRAWRKVLL